MHEAAAGAEGAPCFRDRRQQRRAKVELGPEPAADRHDEPLAVERLGEGEGRPGALEGDSGLGRERLHERQLVRGEGALLLRRRDRDHCDHPVGADERDVRRALRASSSGEPRADTRIADVVDGETGCVPHGRRDPGRLPHEVGALVLPPGDVGAVRPGEIAGRLAAVLRHERERGEVDAEQRADLVQQRAGDALDVGGPGELRGDALEARPLAFPLGDRGPLASDRSHAVGGPDDEADDERAKRRGEGAPSRGEADWTYDLQLSCGHNWAA